VGYRLEKWEHPGWDGLGRDDFTVVVGEIVKAEGFSWGQEGREEGCLRSFACWLPSSTPVVITSKLCSAGHVVRSEYGLPAFPPLIALGKVGCERHSAKLSSERALPIYPMGIYSISRRGWRHL